MDTTFFTDLLTVNSTISLLVASGLILLSCVTAMMTAAMGIGGGVLLLAVMAMLLPLPALIPVHGLVQLGANGNRAFLTRMHIDWAMFRWFCVGAAVGAGLASLVVVQLPLVVIQFAVAGFILFLVWGPSPRKREITALGRCLAGVGTTFLTMFVGATGPLVASFIHRNSENKMVLTSTFAACMTFQHMLKAIVFNAVGFAFFQWLPLVIVMVASGFVGTWLGLKMLHHIPDQRFRALFKVIVSLLAIRLIWQGVQAL